MEIELQLGDPKHLRKMFTTNEHDPSRQTTCQLEDINIPYISPKGCAEIKKKNLKMFLNLMSGQREREKQTKK